VAVYSSAAECAGVSGQCFSGIYGVQNAITNSEDGIIIRVGPGYFCSPSIIENDYLTLRGANASMIPSENPIISPNTDTIFYFCGDSSDQVCTSTGCILNNNLITVRGVNLIVDGIVFDGSNLNTDNLQVIAARGISNYQYVVQSDEFEIGNSTEVTLLVENSIFQYFQDTAIGIFQGYAEILNNTIRYVRAVNTTRKRGSRSSSGSSTSMSSSTSKVSKNSISSSDSGYSSTGTPSSSLSFASRKRTTTECRVAQNQFTDIDGTMISIDSPGAAPFVLQENVLVGSESKIAIGVSLNNITNSLTGTGNTFHNLKSSYTIWEVPQADSLVLSQETHTNIASSCYALLNCQNGQSASTTVATIEDASMTNASTGIYLVDDRKNEFDGSTCSQSGGPIEVYGEGTIQNGDVGLRSKGKNVSWDNCSLNVVNCDSPIATEKNTDNRSKDGYTNCPPSSGEQICAGNGSCSGVNHCSCNSGYT